MSKNNDEKEYVDLIDKLFPEKVAMKVAKVIVFLFIVSIIIAGGVFCYRCYQDRKESKENRIAYLYYCQNKAFAMDEIEQFYLDKTHVREIKLHTYLLAYKFDHPDEDITVADIEEYLGNSEFDENKKLRVLNRPETIENYIKWYMNPTSSKFLVNYVSAIARYYKDTTGKDFNDINEYDSDALDKLGEDFYNYPDKENYLDLSSDQRKYFIDKETLSLFERFSEGDTRAVFSAAISDERLTFNKNFETGKDYSISDIEALFEEKTGEGDFICNKEDIETEYVDLGCDGEYEYRVTLPYSKTGKNLEPPYQYILKMLLKNIDGKLHIIFAYGYYWDSTTNIDSSIVYSNSGEISFEFGDREEPFNYVYFLSTDGSLSYLYTEGTTWTTSENLSIIYRTGADTSFTLKGQDGSETAVNGRGCQLVYFYVDKGTQYVQTLNVYDNEGKKYSQSSDEYQTVQQFYENEEYIFLPDDGAYELKKSIKKNAGLN